MRAFGRYWLMVFLVGINVWEKSERLVSLVAAVVGLIAAFTTFEIGKELRPAYEHWGAVALGVWASIVFLVAAPFRIWVENQEDLAEQKDLVRDKRNKLRLRTDLGAFAMQAMKLVLACDDENKPIPHVEMESLQARIQDYLERNLELSYLARFRSPSSTQVLPLGLSDHQKAKAGWKFRNERLIQFIEELQDQKVSKP